MSYSLGIEMVKVIEILEKLFVIFVKVWVILKLNVVRKYNIRKIRMG